MRHVGHLGNASRFLSLLGLNCAIFVAQLTLQAYQPGAVPEYLGLSYRGIDQAYAWQFFSAMFLHAGVFQFAGNMLVLYFIGRDVESILGQKHFLYLYLAAPIGGELGHLFLMPSTTVLLARFRAESRRWSSPSPPFCRNWS